MVILFTEKSKQDILSGRKTQTRRFWKIWRVKVGGTYQARTQLFGKPFAYLFIIWINQERLGSITPRDVWAEGYDNRQAFFDAIEKINHMKQGTLDLDRGVIVVTFGRVSEGKYGVIK